jgi:hypothetical protein
LKEKSMQTKRAGSCKYLLLTWHEEESGSEKIEEAPEAVLEGRAKQIQDGQRLLSALQERPELSHLDGHREKLETRLRRMSELIEIQTALKAARMDGTQRLTALMADCGRLATVLRFELKQHYGLSAEKLKEFGIQPRRPRSADPLD